MKGFMKLTLERLNEILELDTESYQFVNKIDRGRYKKGDLSGYALGGYTYITIGRKAYPAHKLIWWLFNNSYPTCDIDHIDMDRRNNNINNLRTATRSQNMMNIRPHRDGASGIKNVSFRSDTNKWGVRVSVDGKYKSFGSYDNKELAELVAEEARNKYHGEYARSV